MEVLGELLGVLVVIRQDLLSPNVPSTVRGPGAAGPGLNQEIGLKSLPENRKSRNQPIAKYWNEFIQIRWIGLIAIGANLIMNERAN